MEKPKNSLQDKEIIELILKRDESGLEAIKDKYNSYLFTIANNVLDSEEDSLECVNDTYKKVWDSIPPNEPNNLRGYAGKITRNLAINKYKYNTRDKRNKNYELALAELEECLFEDNGEGIVDDMALKKALDSFLRSVSFKKRTIFILRYWYLCETKDIAKRVGISEVNVKVTLLRLRDKLKKFLEKEGICV